MVIKSVIKGAIKGGRTIMKGVKGAGGAIVKGIKGAVGAGKRLVKGIKSAGRSILNKWGWGAKPKVPKPTGALFTGGVPKPQAQPTIMDRIKDVGQAIRNLGKPPPVSKEKLLEQRARDLLTRTNTGKVVETLPKRTGTGLRKVPYEPPIKMSKKAKGSKPITKKALNEGLGQPNPLLRSKL